LTAYFGERKRSGGQLVADALLDLYERRQLSTSLLVRGIEGFGHRHHLRTDNLLSLSEDLPAVAAVVDRRDRLDALAAETVALVGHGLVTVRSADGGLGESGAAMLTAYLRRQARVDGRPAYVAGCELLYRLGVDGATTLLGVDGTRAGRRERARFFARNADVPMAIVAVGAAERIADAEPELRALLGESVITLEPVQVCKRDGALLERPAPDAKGWYRVSVFTSEAQVHRGRSIHREITLQLRGSGARGATTLRGIWGFHAPALPHGELLTQLSRHVPMITTVIDAADRIEACFTVIDRLTEKHGLVTCAPVQVLS
jgi:PII-like signaling protein